jgi:hypothetical protein
VLVRESQVLVRETQEVLRKLQQVLRKPHKRLRKAQLKNMLKQSLVRDSQEGDLLKKLLVRK